MDKTWMLIDDTRDFKFQNGVEEFLNFAYAYTEPEAKIRCPCKKCNNVYFHYKDDVRADLLHNGIRKDYNPWILHGEEPNQSSDDELDSDNESDDEHQGHLGRTYSDQGVGAHSEMQELLQDLYVAATTNAWEGEKDNENESSVPKWEADKFMRLLRDADKELYPGCKDFSRLSFVVKLMHLKIINRWSNKSFAMQLELLKKALPDGETLPRSYYEAKKLIKDLGLNYQKIHVCINDCVLFRKEYAGSMECPKCFAPRYKPDGVNVEVDGKKKRKRIPQKVLRYFPLKPRLQRLFISEKTARDMKWHKEKRVNDGVLRHPADSQTWKEFDKTYESFAGEPRNVRLGLASDGFNPFSNMSTSHSTWPVILVPYNLPPWKCMKSPFFILSMIIPGPKSPGNDIDVYLEPLIDELNDLWDNGVETYDASTGTNFQLRAAVMWTISDFPAYANLSGWSTKGFLACPNCNKETTSHWLKNGRKVCYMGHRKFLPPEHEWRQNRSSFDGSKELKQKPMSLSGDGILDQLTQVQKITFGKTQSKKRKREEDLNWTKYSVFFRLPYWKTLKLRHNLDVMHIEKNIFDNIFGTLMNIDGKTKDNFRARLDLQAMRLRPQLHPKVVGSSYVMPPACYTLSMEEKKRVCEFIKSVKFPDGYAANIAKCVNSNNCRFVGMKSHDCHIFLQQLLPLAIRGLLKDNVCDAITELCQFFLNLCSRALNIEDLKRMDKEITVTLCKLERIFPPAFFDIMVHLPVHLAEEAILAGPVQYRWMYPIERYLCKLKHYVNNKASPEGCIAEGYVVEECLTFCSMYLNGIETRFNRAERNYEGHKLQPHQGLSIFSDEFRVIGEGHYIVMDEKLWKQAHTYVLKNCDEVIPFLDEHKEELEQNGVGNVLKRHEETFPSWFEQCVTQLSKMESKRVNIDLQYLSCAPDKRVNSYEACIINGLRFHTKARELTRKTQNSGIMVKGEENSACKNYYGVLKEIIQLDYFGNNHILLFKCDWYEGKSVKIDKHNYTSINLSKPWNTNEPFVLASQAEQVFYVDDIKLGRDWKVVIKGQARGSWNILENEDEQVAVTDEAFQQNTSHSDSQNLTEISKDFASWHRDDIPPISVNDQSHDLVVNERDKDIFVIDEEDDEDETLDEYNDEEDIENDEDHDVDTEDSSSEC